VWNFSAIAAAVAAAAARGYMPAGTEVVAAAIYPQATAAATAAAAIALKFHPKHEKRKQKTLTKRTNSQ
jgi:hypothetical protein